MLKKYGLEIKWGLIFSAMMLLWMIGEKALGYHDEKIAQHPIVTNLIFIPAFIIYYLALVDKRKQLGGFMSWRQGFFSGVLIGLVVMLLAPLLQYLTSEVVSPDYFANAITYSVESGNATPQEAEDFFNLSNYMIMATVSAPIMGAITAAIMALFVRRKPEMHASA